MPTETLVIENFQQYSRSSPYSLKAGFNGLIVSPLSFMSQAIIRTPKHGETRLSRHQPVVISSGAGATIWPALPFNKSLGGGNWVRWAVDSLVLTTFPERVCLDQTIALHRPYKDIITAYYDEVGDDSPPLMNDFAIPIQEFSFVNVVVEPESALDFFVTPADWTIIILLDYEEVLNTTFSSTEMTSHRLDARGKNTMRVLVSYTGVSTVPNTHVIVTGG